MGAFLFLLPVVKEWKMTAGAAIVLFNRRHPGVAVGGCWGGGGEGGVDSLVAKSSTTIKDISGYIVIRSMWLCVIVDRKGWWKLRVVKRPSCLFTPYSGVASVIRMH